MPSRLAVRSQEYASCFATSALILSMAEWAKATAVLLHSLSRELVAIRGSRTLIMPLPTKYLSLAGLTRNSFRSARCDQPSLTFALMPNAPSRKRTARTDRPRRSAIFETGSYPAQFNKWSSSAAVQGRERWREFDGRGFDSSKTFSGEHDEMSRI